MKNNNEERRRKIHEALSKRKLVQNVDPNIAGRQVIRNSDGSAIIVQRNKRQVVELARIPPSIKKMNDFRPNSLFLTKLVGNNKKLDLPIGSFNGSILRLPDKYLLVYRPNEYVFDAAFLDLDLNVIPNTTKRLNLNGDVADPRLIITPSNKVMVSYSRFNLVLNHEIICGSYIMDLNIGEDIIESDHFRISPVELFDRQKNWMPFVHDGKIFFISDVCPHRIYEYDEENKISNLIYETSYKNSWFNTHQLRGNTNCLRVSDDYYLTIFHTAQKIEICSFYDNGAYLFEAKPPFKPVMFSNRSIMPAEFAMEKHFRKMGEIECVFPISLHQEGNQILISYGDNDSAVRVFTTNLDEIASFMIRI
jgi:predicted GH43/DUF377 family glycosyl hydrolase